MYKIQVLMSTYNGRNYLREQLESILGQDCERMGRGKIEILIRDDGSTDGTQNILEDYAYRFSDRITWYQGENLGVIGSFLDLVKHSDDNADFYAFSDQDDVWMPDKISCGVKILDQMPNKMKPNLYCCRPLIVDETLRDLECGRRYTRMFAGFGNAMVENIVVGCTIVMNDYLRNMLLAKMPDTDKIMMHDRWIYQVASCFGEVFYDEGQHICYRQHRDNTVGMTVNRGKEFFERVFCFRKKCRAISMQVTEFYRLYHNFLEEEEGKIFRDSKKVRWNMELLEEYVNNRKSLKTRKKLLKENRLYRQRATDNRFFRFLFLLGCF